MAFDQDISYELAIIIAHIRELVKRFWQFAPNVRPVLCAISLLPICFHNLRSARRYAVCAASPRRWEKEKGIRRSPSRLSVNYFASLTACASEPTMRMLPVL